MTQPPGPPAPGAPQNPYGQNPYGAPPPAPKKTWFARHKVLTAIGGIIAVIVVISVASGGGSDSGTGDAGGSSTDAAPGDAATPSAKAEKKLPGIGAPARDGKFEFVVRGVRDGGTSIGPEFMKQRAQGSYTLVDLTVRNTGDEAQSLSISEQKLLSASGTEFSPDSLATTSLDSSPVFYEQINPGNSLEVTVVYDLPAGTSPATMELHDSIFSGGVTVSLR